MPERINIRFVMVKGVKYLREEDIISLLKEFGATEETDTRERVEKLCAAIKKP